METNNNILKLTAKEVEKLSENILNNASDNYWDRLSSVKGLSEDFIRKFADKVNWKCISKYQKLSEYFIKEFADIVDWECISIYQTLSENFIREFQNKVN